MLGVLVAIYHFCISTPVCSSCFVFGWTAAKLRIVVANVETCGAVPDIASVRVDAREFLLLAVLEFFLISSSSWTCRRETGELGCASVKAKVKKLSASWGAKNGRGCGSHRISGWRSRRDSCSERSRRECVLSWALRVQSLKRTATAFGL